MKFILAGLNNFHSEWPLLEAAVVKADRLGFWEAVIPDHYMWGPMEWQPRAMGDSTVESWIALTYLAAKTERIRLGTLVTPIPFRPPGVLAKMVATLDVLSNGRTILGVGAGWSRVEFEGYSEWEEPRIRVEKTEEGVRLILKLWTEQRVDFDGDYYHARGAVLEPKPIQKPHPPLLFGGERPRMLRMAGRYADICHIPSWVKMSIDEARKIVLESARLCSREKSLSFAGGSVSVPKPASNEQYRREVEEARRMGCEYFLVAFPRQDYIGRMEEFAKEFL